jgi:hypothetical protein
VPRAGGSIAVRTTYAGAQVSKQGKAAPIAPGVYLDKLGIAVCLGPIFGKRRTTGMRDGDGRVLRRRCGGFGASKPVEMASKPRSGFVLGMSLAAARVAGQAVSGVEAA